MSRISQTIAKPARSAATYREILRLKRVAGVVSGLVFGLFTLPFVLLAALLIWLYDRRSPWFWQQRAGRDGQIFWLLKLRTMQVNDLSITEMGQVEAGNPLITPIGKLLRRTKIDELPQLWNVLRGEMSIVGPRPAPAEQLAGYDPFQRRRLELPPGITGWAQINGNVQFTWPERIALDVWYIDHWSPWLDLKIVLKTFAVALTGERRNEQALQQAEQHAQRTRRNA